MGVPALFRWLSKKYPKIVEKVVEDTPTKWTSPDGEDIIIPVKYEDPNPNGFEVDCLYLDMNGIVHPCTHPEGKPAPETEEEMMVEVFKYTERVVNMARPRKLLMMAIDGVAPRAKMNQQRSRRFRAAQEASEKEEERKEAIKLFEAMGHPVSEATQNKKSWDSNAITPGTPFMDLLAASLRYWVAHKLNTDPGWKDVQVIISDASVPGEGEHKIMDWIRRQRSHPEHDPNTSHVIYGLDADLIMLALATHEPHFKVLREDVFAQQSRDSACRICGQTGHIAANCKGDKVSILASENKAKVEKPVEDKPFIFLDVGVLREYLAIELDLRLPTIPFDLERAIDDWVFLIFFVGNDFLPHLPSLEIREGAIDTLLKIWKTEFERMGGYLTNHGKVELARAQIILEGLAKSEDEIFQRRKEAEERQDRNEKRRRVEEHRHQDNQKAAKQAGPGLSMGGTEYVAVPVPASDLPPRIHPSLPTRPGFEVLPTAEVVKPVAPTGSDKKANLSAAEALKAELAASMGDDEEETDTVASVVAPETAEAPAEAVEEDTLADEGDVDESMADDQPASDLNIPALQGDQPRGKKRKAKKQGPGLAVEGDEDEDEEENDEDEAPPNPDADQPVPKKKLQVNANGTVEYDDDVKLWEPGYRERYYRSKFGVELSDVEFRKQVVKSYLEGLSWVLHYYYQGTPSWNWFYPYHYAPFAADFENITQYEIGFKLGQPFKPFEQLMGVFPAASRKHLPEPYQLLMTEEESPILDFYPGDFEIDMNGKKMAWQGIALLPFIEQDRLLAAIATKEPQLTVDERRRNAWGDNVMLVAEKNKLHDGLCELYTKQKPKAPIPIDAKLSRGVLGGVLADPHFIPGSTIYSPLSDMDECPDIHDNSSLSVRYYFPKMMKPHRSVFLPGAKPDRPVLNESDREFVRSGGSRGRGRGGGPGMGGAGRGGRAGYSSGASTPNGRGGYAGGSGYSTPSYGSPAGRGGYGSSYDNSPWMNPAGAGTAPRGGYSGNGLGGYGGSPAAAPSANGYGGYGVGASYSAPSGRAGYGGNSPYSNIPTGYASRPPSSGPTPHAHHHHQTPPYPSPYASVPGGTSSGYQGYGSGGARGGYGGTGAGRGGYGGRGRGQ